MENQTELYLRSMSSLAQKIGQDIDTARDAYQDLWNTLSLKEQQQVVDEAIIDPAAVLKYSITNQKEHQLLYQSSNGNSFSWFTRSQLNLFTDNSLLWPNTPIKKTDTAIIGNGNGNNPQENIVIENKTKENNLLNKIKSKVTNLKIPSTVEEKQSLVENKNQAILVKTLLSKPKTPPPPPPIKQVRGEKKALLSVDNESDPDDIPKTGFDFLDNW